MVRVMADHCWCGKPVVFHSGEWWHQLGVGDEVRLWVGQGPDPEPDHEPRPVEAVSPVGDVLREVP